MIRRQHFLITLLLLPFAVNAEVHLWRADVGVARTTFDRPSLKPWKLKV